MNCLSVFDHFMGLALKGLQRRLMVLSKGLLKNVSKDNFRTLLYLGPRQRHKKFNHPEKCYFVFFCGICKYGKDKEQRRIFKY